MLCFEEFIDIDFKKNRDHALPISIQLFAMSLFYYVPKQVVVSAEYRSYTSFVIFFLNVFYLSSFFARFIRKGIPLGKPYCELMDFVLIYCFVWLSCCWKACHEYIKSYDKYEIFVQGVVSWRIGGPFSMMYAVLVYCSQKCVIQSITKIYNFLLMPSHCCFQKAAVQSNEQTCSLFL